MKKFWVCYINLDSRVDRKQHIESELISMNIEWNRISAITPSQLTEIQRQSDINLLALACTRSHIKALENFLATDYQFALILEDDFHWIRMPDAELIQKIVEFDLVSTGSIAREHSKDHFVEFVNNILWRFRRLFPSLGIKLQRWIYDFDFTKEKSETSTILGNFGAGTHGYFISKSGAIKIKSILENNYYPIDQMFNMPLIDRVIKVGRVYPPIGNQIPSYSDIRER